MGHLCEAALGPRVQYTLRYMPHLKSHSESPVCTPGSFFLSSFRVWLYQLWCPSIKWIFKGHGIQSPKAWLHVHCCLHERGGAVEEATLLARAREQAFGAGSGRKEGDLSPAT